MHLMSFEPTQQALILGMQRPHLIPETTYP